MDTADCLARGREFHGQLFALIGTLHPPDETHDLVVGAAVMRAVGGDPAGAVGAYNDWAESHGYAPIAWLGTFTTPDGRRHEWVDIRDAVIGLSPDYRVTVLDKERVCPSGPA
jgi:hypothetical protein